MFGQSVVILSAPLSGARPLAEALFKEGWHTGGLCMPDRRDPSQSSFENTQLVTANKILLGKTAPTWNEGGFNNWAVPHDASRVPDVQRVWADLIRATFSAPTAVIKDAQLAFTIRKWMPVWHSPVLSSPPHFEVIVLFRFPVDFVASALAGCDRWWPEVPKDADYFLNLWIKYYQAILDADNGIHTFRYFQSTDHLTDAVSIKRFNWVTGSHLGPLSLTRVQNRIRRDKARMSKEAWSLYDQLYWRTMASVPANVNSSSSAI
jgi:hypothetical protein